MITLTIVSLSIGILTSIITAIIAVSTYLKERDKRVGFEKAYIEVNARLQVNQQSNQQVNINLLQADSIAQKIDETKEIDTIKKELEKLKQKLTYASSVSNGTLKINALPIADPLTKAMYSNIARAEAIKKAYYNILEQEKNKEKNG